MKYTYKLFSAAVVCLAGLSPVQAVVVNSGFGAVAALAAASPFSNVVRINIDNGGGSFGVCTGSLISATTILTAKHCTESGVVGNYTVDFDQNGDGVLQSGIDQTNSISSIFRAPDAPSNPNLIDGTDLALLTLSGLLPNWVNSLFQKLWDGSVLGSLVTMVGYGGQGENSLQSGPGGSRWAAQNVADKVGAAGFNEPNSANIISTDFDNPVGSGFPSLGTGNTLGASPVDSSPDALSTEGTTAGGDSGGPLLIELNNEWLIAGVLSGGTRGDSGFGDISWWTGVGNYRTQIEAAGGVFYSNTVPEPGALALVVLALFAAGALGKQRQMN